MAVLGETHGRSVDATLVREKDLRKDLAASPYWQVRTTLSEGKYGLDVGSTQGS